jgi:hypothetical protein
MCKCGKKLLLEIEKDDAGKTVGIALHRPTDTSDLEECSCTFIVGLRNSRTMRTWSFGLSYVYCRACKARAQVRTFDTLEEYLDKK